jgi:hypothetical protein
MMAKFKILETRTSERDEYKGGVHFDDEENDDANGHGHEDDHVDEEGGHEQDGDIGYAVSIKMNGDVTPFEGPEAVKGTDIVLETLLNAIPAEVSLPEKYDIKYVTLANGRSPDCISFVKCKSDDDLAIYKTRTLSACTCRSMYCSRFV